MIHISHRYELFFFMLSLPFFLLVLSNHYRHYGMCGQNCQSFSSGVLSVACPSAPIYLLLSLHLFLPVRLRGRSAYRVNPELLNR